MKDLLEDLRPYIVGSVFQRDPEKPPRQPGDALNEMWDLSGSPLTISGGEWRTDEQDWLVVICREIARRAGIPEELLERFPGSAYWHYGIRRASGWIHRHKIRTRIEAEGLPRPAYLEWAREDYRAFVDRLRTSSEDTVFLRGMPTPLALLFFAGLPMEHLPRFEVLIAEIITEIVEACPGVVIQFELPLELGLGVMRPGRRAKRQAFYRRMMESVWRVIRLAPADVRYAFHLCWGDLRSRPVVPRWRQKTAAKVDLMNVITAATVWLNHAILFAIHDPFCDGKRRHKPRLRRKDLREYKKLDEFPPGAFYAAGILHVGIRAKKLAKMTIRLGNVLALKGIAFRGISTPCGNGRMSERQAHALYLLKNEVNRWRRLIGRK